MMDGAFSNVGLADVGKIVEKAKNLIHEEKYGEAIEYLKAEIKQVKKLKNNGLESCYTFDELFQFDIFIHFYSGLNSSGKKKKQKNKMSGNVVWRTEPVDDLYYYCGYALVETGEEEQALNTYRMGLEWNPCSLSIRFEMINILKGSADLNELYRELKNVYKYIYRPEDLSRFYRDMGYAYIEEKKWDAAIVCYFLSMEYTDNEDSLNRANGELCYIEETSGKEIHEPGEEEIMEIARAYKIPIGIDERLLKLAQDKYTQSKARGDADTAKYYKTIYDGLTGDEGSMDMSTKGEAEELLELGDQAELKKDYALSVKYYQQAAELGNTDAMAHMGLYYQYGDGVEQSFAKAIEWYQKVLDAGDGDGWYLLGTVYEDMEDYEKSAECYEKQIEEGGTCKYGAFYGLAKAYRYGLGKEVNFPLALDFYQRAAGHGEIAAMVDLGELYFHGDGVKEDNEIANYWFEKAANSYNGNWCAFAHLGMAYHHGWGKEVDYGKAKEYYEKALAAGEENILCPFGEIYYDEKDYEKAWDYFRRAAVEGNQFQRDAEEHIADMYYYGHGAAQDFAKAAEWYEKAAEHGNSDAMCSLAVMFINDEEMPKDEEKALHWMLEAANNGSVSAMENMGRMYKNGDCVPQDAVASLAWFKKSAEHGNPDAMFSVGGCYYQGLGVEEDWRQAKEWFTKAWTAGNNDALYFLGMIYADEEKSSRAEEFLLQAANDDENYFQEDAQDSLALMYYTGNGVVQDTELAIEWAEKAAEQGNDNSMLLLGDIYMEGVGMEQDIAKAKEWYEKAKAAGNDEAEQRLTDLS